MVHGASRQILAFEALPWRPPTLPAQFSRTAYGFGAYSMWLLGEFGILLFCSPGFWGVGGFLRALSSPREAS